MHYQHPSCFEAPVLGATMLTQPALCTLQESATSSDVESDPDDVSIPSPMELLSPTPTTNTHVASTTSLSFNPGNSSSKTTISNSTTSSPNTTSSPKTESRPSSQSPTKGDRTTGSSTALPEVFHMKLDLSRMPDAHFEPGDSIGIRCPNDLCTFDCVFLCLPFCLDSAPYYPHSRFSASFRLW